MKVTRVGRREERKEKQEKDITNEKSVQVTLGLRLGGEKREISSSSLEHFGNRDIFSPMYATMLCSKKSKE